MAKSKKARKKRGSQNAGRPRKTEGVERWKNGRVKSETSAPNEKVVILRRAMLGDSGASLGTLVVTENPMDFILAKGWINEDLHLAGKTYAELVERSGFQIPKMKTFDPERSPGGYDASVGDAGAMLQLKALWMRLTPETARILTEVCVMKSWPQWVIYRVAGRNVPCVWDDKRMRLIAGLVLAKRWLKPGRPDKPAAPATEQSESQRRAMAT